MPSYLDLAHVIANKVLEHRLDCFIVRCVSQFLNGMKHSVLLELILKSVYLELNYHKISMVIVRMALKSMVKCAGTHKFV